MSSVVLAEPSIMRQSAQGGVLGNKDLRDIHDENMQIT